MKPVVQKKPTPAKKIQPRPSFAKKPKYDDISSDEEDVKPVVKGKGKAKAKPKALVDDDVSFLFFSRFSVRRRELEADCRHSRLSLQSESEAASTTDSDEDAATKKKKAIKKAADQKNEAAHKKKRKEEEAMEVDEEGDEEARLAKATNSAS